MTTRRDLLRKAGGGAAALAAGSALAAVTMPAHAEPDPLVEMAERYVRLKASDDAAAARVRAARETMEAAGYRPLEALGLFLAITPKHPDGTCCYTREELRAAYEGIEGLPDEAFYRRNLDRDLRRFDELEPERERFGIVSAEAAERATSDVAGQLWEEIRATPATTLAGVQAMLRALFVNIGLDPSTANPNANEEMAATILSNVRRLAEVRS
jgi:hypothetical protein